MTMRTLWIRFLIVALAVVVSCAGPPKGEQAAMSEDSLDHGASTGATQQDSPVPMVEEPFSVGQNPPTGMLQDLDTVRAGTSLNLSRPAPLPNEPRAVTGGAPR